MILFFTIDNILSNFKESINELEKMIDKGNEEKENIKLKIQKLFTKIRNALNKREDELFLEVDKIYEYINEKENIAKENQRLLKKSKTSLEKGKELENEWNNNAKLNLMINTSLIIEKSLNDMNIIKEKIENSNNKNEKEKDFFPNLDINKF